MIKSGTEMEYPLSSPLTNYCADHYLKIQHRNPELPECVSLPTSLPSLLHHGGQARQAGMSISLLAAFDSTVEEFTLPGFLVRRAFFFRIRGQLYFSPGVPVFPLIRKGANSEPSVDRTRGVSVIITGHSFWRRAAQRPSLFLSFPLNRNRERRDSGRDECTGHSRAADTTLRPPRPGPVLCSTFRPG